MKKLALFLFAWATLSAQSAPLAELIDLARKGPSAPGLKDRVIRTLGARGGNGVWGQDYLFVAESAAPVSISVDGQPGHPYGRG